MLIVFNGTSRRVEIYMRAECGGMSSQNTLHPNSKGCKLFVNLRAGG
jgi:hypothetical protein